MRLKIRIGVVAVLAVIAIILAVVVVARVGAKTVTVQQVLDKPDAYYGRVVHVKGTAADATPAVAGYRAFRLEDGDASVWVITKGSAPQGGERIVVNGRVATGARVKLPVVGTVAVGAWLVEESRDEP